MLALILLASPCSQASPIDAGEVANCSGILATTKQIKEAVITKQRLKALEAIPCPVCPPCLSCPKERPQRLTPWIFGSAFAGGLITLLSAVTLERIFTR